MLPTAFQPAFQLPSNGVFAHTPHTPRVLEHPGWKTGAQHTGAGLPKFLRRDFGNRRHSVQTLKMRFSFVREIDG
jgi:hypothetical protein